MNPRKRKFRIFLLVTLTAVTAAAGSLAWLNRREHISEVFTTQRPGEAQITWHTMRTRWERGIFDDGSTLSITSTASDQSALYAIIGDKVCKIDKATGVVSWSKPPTLSGETNSPSLNWHVELAAEHVIADEIAENNSSPNTVNSRISCLNGRTGALLWEIALTGRIASSPAIIGSRIVIPLTTGEMICVNVMSGFQYWRRQISLTHYAAFKQGYGFPVLHVEADNSSCIVRAGADHFMALDLTTGETLWSRCLSRSVRHSEWMNVSVAGFTLKDGVIYIAAVRAKITAWDAATGKTIWRRLFILKGDERNYYYVGQDEPPIVSGGLVLTMRGGNIAAVRRKSGASVWAKIQLYSTHRFELDDGNYVAERYALGRSVSEFYHDPGNVTTQPPIYFRLPSSFTFPSHVGVG